MHAIIAGCGRVGAQLATALSDQGHEVAVIDKNPRAFRRLGDAFAGKTLRGYVFDRPTLEAAGVRHAQAFVAVTSGDNSNIVSARGAREVYGVEHVVARIYDPERAVIYERLGITTIASARWTAESILRIVLPDEDAIEGSVGPGQGDVVIVTGVLPSAARGVSPDALTRAGHFLLVAVTREGATRIPTAGGVLHGGDRVHLAVQRESLDQARELLRQFGEEVNR